MSSEVIIGIDPGHTTGVAVMRKVLGENYFQYIASRVIPQERFTMDMTDFLMGWQDMLDTIVIERYPPRYPDPVTVAIFTQAVAMSNDLVSSPKVVVISPGDWKPVAKLQGWKGWGKTPHEKDASRIAQYWDWFVTNTQSKG